MTVLFEYGKWHSISDRARLMPLLNDMWLHRKILDENGEVPEGEDEKKYQPFLKFDGDKIQAKNYVGFIQNGDEVIEIYPKVFKDHFPEPDSNQKNLMFQHIFFWFNYCKRLNFPFNQVSLDTLDVESFPELIIRLFASKFYEVLSEQPLAMYQQLEEPLLMPRGSINFKRYINNSLSYGKYHAIECDYEPFLYNNKVNQIIKYCARLLAPQTKNWETSRLLQEVTYILDEVDDIYCTINDIDRIRLNSHFTDYITLLDFCRLILNQQLYARNEYDLSQWCLLFPMEYIFEDFIAGFIEENFSDKWEVKFQKSEMYLCNQPQVFKMKNDIFLSQKNGGTQIIIDTKYKVRASGFENNPKRGIYQPDLYQMVSYAFKRGCSNVLMIYPEESNGNNSSDEFKITSGFDEKREINVKAIGIPFYTLNNIGDLESSLRSVLDKIFMKYIEV